MNPPTVTDLFTIDGAMQEKLDNLKHEQTGSVIEKSSKFVGYAFRVNNTSEVKLAYKKCKSLAPDADHIMSAYKVKQYQGYHDNGEHAAVKRLMKILNDRNLQNTAVFVSRVYGSKTLCFN